MKIAFSFEIKFRDTEIYDTFPRGMKSEILFPRKIWKSLKDGDYIIYRKSGKLAKIKEAKDGFIRMESGAVYVTCDRLFFIPVFKEHKL